VQRLFPLTWRLPAAQASLSEHWKTKGTIGDEVSNLAENARKVFYQVLAYCIAIWCILNLLRNVSAATAQQIGSENNCQIA
jgi:hypothetical protein